MVRNSEVGSMKFLLFSKGLEKHEKTFHSSALILTSSFIKSVVILIRKKKGLCHFPPELTANKLFEHCLQATIYISSFRNCVIANVRKWQCSYNSESVSPQKELRFYFPVTKPISKFNPFIYNKFMYWKTLKVLTIFINHQSKSPASL